MSNNSECEQPDVTITGIFRLNIIKRHLSQSQAKQNNALTTTASTKPKQFKFTCPGGAFTQEQREHYERNGFVVVKKLISDEKLEKYKKRFQTICSEKIKVPG